MRRIQTLALVLLLTLPIAGCELIGDLLQIGFWMFVIFIGVIVLAVWALRRAFRRRTPPPPPPGRPLN